MPTQQLGGRNVLTGEASNEGLCDLLVDDARGALDKNINQINAFGIFVGPNHLLDELKATVGPRKRSQQNAPRDFALHRSQAARRDQPVMRDQGLDRHLVLP